MLPFRRLASVLAASCAVANALTNILVPITDDFGPNPTNVGMYIYKPARLASPTPLIVAMHGCGGSAREYYMTGDPILARLADIHGILLIYPDSPELCWDVYSNDSLKHDGGSDSLAIASVVRWAIRTKGVDPSLVFAAGSSSGAMMTYVLMGAYPDLFNGGVGFAGVPFGCWAGPSWWNADCAEGHITMTPQEWGDRVRNAYPGYAGPRPKVQIWHGTADYILRVQNFWEGIKQWTNVFGVSQTPISNVTGYPLGHEYSRASYGPEFEAILGQGVGHAIPPDWNEAINWFGLTGSVPVPRAPASAGTISPSEEVSREEL